MQAPAPKPEFGPHVEPQQACRFELAELNRRGSVRFEAVDRQRVFWRPSRLLLMLGRQPTWPDIFLFALVDAAGLAEGLLAQAAYPPPPERIRTLSAGLAQSYPGTVELVAVVRRLADRIAVAPR